MNSQIDSSVLMPDVQSTLDERHIAIQRVGIRRVKQPMLLQAEDGSVQPTVAEWTFTVMLPAHEKGTHMSRFMALLNSWRNRPMTVASLREMALEMLPLLHAEKGDMTVTFPYFVNKKAPVSGVESLMDYQVTWLVEAHKDQATVEQTIVVPVMSLCPCSKAISEYGAHNQRSHVTVSVVADREYSLASLIERIEAQGSSQLWALLKRTDEKYVTEHSYDNPKFVEDLVRDVAAVFQKLPGVVRYRVEAENFESIHNHSAYAVVEG